MAKPCCFSHDVTAETSCEEGENWSRNWVGDRNCPAFALPGVDTDSAKAAAASPPRHARYTRKTTASLPLAARARFDAFAHDGTLPARDVREGAAADSRINPMDRSAMTIDAENFWNDTRVSLLGEEYGRGLCRVRAAALNR